MSERSPVRSGRDRLARIDYDFITALGKKLDRPMSTLLALADDNDPFFADRPARRHGAEWFANLWRQFEFGAGTHVRRVHYKLISQGTPILGADGHEYENTYLCWHNLKKASKDARYLGLVPVEDFEDHRNDEVCEHLADAEQAAILSVSEANELSADLSYLQINSWLGELPGFAFYPPIVNQRFHVELWCEKTTMNDILLDLAQDYALNVVTASGEISVTHCYQLIERAKDSGRPVRILYISDFDPAGMSIPVACARKIEFFLHREQLDLDVQVRPVALTHDQCVEYRLPRTPLKETERRGQVRREVRRRRD